MSEPKTHAEAFALAKEESEKAIPGSAALLDGIRAVLLKLNELQSTDPESRPFRSGDQLHIHAVLNVDAETGEPWIGVLAIHPELRPNIIELLTHAAQEAGIDVAEITPQGFGAPILFPGENRDN